jgi:hypothetical protein
LYYCNVHNVKCPYYIKNSYRSQINNLNVITDEINSENQNIHEYLKIPVLKGAISPKILDNINSNIKNDIFEFKDQLELSADEDAKEKKSSGSNFSPFQISNNYILTYNKNGLLSISLIFQELVNGRNSYIRTSYNYNLKTGESMPLESLFITGTDYIDLLNKQIIKEIKANSSSYSSNTLSNFKGIAKDQPYYLDNNNLNIFFGFNQISPINSEISFIRIPYENLISILKPDITRSYI